MKIVKFNQDSVDIQFSVSELIILKNVIKVENFEQKIGTSQTKAKTLLSEINQIATQMINLSKPVQNKNIKTLKHKQTKQTLVARKEIDLTTYNNQFLFYFRTLDSERSSLGLVILFKPDKLNDSLQKKSGPQKNIYPRFKNFYR